MITSPYFKTVLIQELLVVPPNKPPIDKVIELIIQPEVINKRLIAVEEGVNNEGVSIQPYQLLVQLRLHERLSYAHQGEGDKVQIAYYDLLKTASIGLPEEIDGVSTMHYFRSERLKVSLEIEANQWATLEGQTLQHCVACLITVEVI